MNVERFINIFNNENEIEEFIIKINNSSEYTRVLKLADDSALFRNSENFEERNRFVVDYETVKFLYFSKKYKRIFLSRSTASETKVSKIVDINKFYDLRKKIKFKINA